MRLAVFDIDGTLISKNRVEDACYVEACWKVFGFDEVDCDWSKYENVTDMGLVTELCHDRLGRAPDSNELKDFRDLYCTLLIARLEPDDGLEIPGARAFLKRLVASGEWSIAVATGNFRRMAVHKIEHAALPCADVPTATSDDTAIRAELLSVAVARSQYHYHLGRFDHVVAVGDGPWDLAAAKESKIPFVAVGDSCAMMNADLQLTDFTDPDRAEQVLSRASLW